MLNDIWTAINEERYADARRLLEQDADLRASNAGQMALGYLLAREGSFDEAITVYSALRDDARRRHDLTAQRIALHQLGRTGQLARRYEEAAAYFQAERDLLDPSDAHADAMNAAELGDALLMQGRHDEARRWLERARDLARDSDDPVALGTAWRELGKLAAHEGDLKTAREAYRNARSAFVEEGDLWLVKQVDALTRELPGR